jgi:hypothetical protein
MSENIPSWYVTACDERDQLEYRFVDIRHLSCTRDIPPEKLLSPAEEDSQSA